MLAGHGRTVMSGTYCDVTHHLQDVATAHCIACYHGDDRLGHPPYLHLKPNSDTSACLGTPCPEQKIAGLVLLLRVYVTVYTSARCKLNSNLHKSQDKHS